MNFGQSRLSGLSLGAFIIYLEESDCVLIVRGFKVVTETRFDSSPVRSAITATAELLIGYIKHQLLYYYQ